MKRTLKTIVSAALIAATLTITAPITAIPAAAATGTSRGGYTYTEMKQTKMYITKDCYSYYDPAPKSAEIWEHKKGDPVAIIGKSGKYYMIGGGYFIAASNLSTKRINWTDTEYPEKITRYVCKKANVRTGALKSSKAIKSYKTGKKLTIVGYTNTGYYKLKDGNYFPISATCKSNPSTLKEINANTKYPEDKYGPGENGYPELGSFYEGDGDGDGYIFIDVGADTVTGTLAELRYDPCCFTEKKLTAIGGKDIPYGWYCIVGRDHDTMHARKYFPYEKLPTLDIYGTDGKLKTYGIYKHGELFYLGKGEKLVARNVVIAPAKNATITYRGVPFEEYSTPLQNTELQQSALVTKKGTGYGLEAGTYKVTVDPDTERFHPLENGVWVYVVHNYANIKTANTHCTINNNNIPPTRDLATTGEFLYSDANYVYPSTVFTIENGQIFYVTENGYTHPYRTYEKGRRMEFDYHFDKNGKYLTDHVAIQIQPESLTPKTIKLKAGDFIICRGCTVEKIG